MNAPTPSAPASLPTPPQARLAQASVGAAQTATAAAAAIARAEAIAAARPVAPSAVTSPSTPSSTVAKPVANPRAPMTAPTSGASAAVSAAAAADDEKPWRSFFNDWPTQIPKRGILISRLNEASPFKSFMIRGDFLLLERTSPDSLGGRFLVIPFDEISVVKFTDPLTQPALEAAGFAGQLAH